MQIARHYVTVEDSTPHHAWRFPLQATLSNGWGIAWQKNGRLADDELLHMTNNEDDVGQSSFSTVVGWSEVLAALRNGSTSEGRSGVIG